MKTFSTSYHKTTAWSDELPELDSPQTLILVFGSSSYINFSTPFEELKQKYPQSLIAGCSTAGEIIGDEVLDDSLVVSISRFDNTQLRLFTTPSIAMEASYSVGEDIAKNSVKECIAHYMHVFKSEGVCK